MNPKNRNAASNFLSEGRLYCLYPGVYGLHPAWYRVRIPLRTGRRSVVDSTDQLDMPVAIENGTIKVELGEYIKLSGTPLNTRIKEFLDALQHCKDGVVSKTDITPEEISEIFSQFYKQQILSNKDNAVGEYIYRNYGVHLNTDDNKQVKAQMGN